MSAGLPDLPVLTADDSMLSRKFGREVANYFSGSPLNRVSFLRSDQSFLSAAFAHPSTSFLLLDNYSPLAKDKSTLAYVSKEDIVPLTGSEPFKRSEEEQIKTFNSTVTQPLILFLGLDEKKPGFQYREYAGRPYFAIDVTPKGSIEEQAKSVIEAVKAKPDVTFLPGGRIVSLNAPEAAIYAQARALLDWNARNPFCGGCGSRTLSINAGTKRVCPPTDLAGVPEGGEAKQRPECPTRRGISNLCFPRTDPTVIMAIVSADGTKILLGRNKRYPPGWYSVLAGFLEPGESIEEAVRREAWEESGVTVGRVVLHSSQPWPYPANLMIGAIGQALPGGENIHLGNDPELETARWYTFDEVREAMESSKSAVFGAPVPESEVDKLRVPPATAIANQLMAAVVDGWLNVNPPKI
ncbi:NUDIX hydrolase domain-like protein [Xylaria sp. CBS 124048]|nr:NUDIX hydrolase domain-like protein [Xylaria sp. CBS 124048]